MLFCFCGFTIINKKKFSWKLFWYYDPIPRTFEAGIVDEHEKRLRYAVWFFPEVLFKNLCFPALPPVNSYVPTRTCSYPHSYKAQKRWGCGSLRLRALAAVDEVCGLGFMVRLGVLCSAKTYLRLGICCWPEELAHIKTHCLTKLEPSMSSVPESVASGETTDNDEYSRLADCVFLTPLFLTVRTLGAHWALPLRL